MKDPSEALRDAIYTLLNGNVTYNSKDVKVFKTYPKDNEIPIVKGQLYHYIEIGDISDTETNMSSDTFTHDTTMDIFVVVGFPGIGSKVVTENIANQVKQLIQPSKGGKLSLGSDFSNIIIRLDISFPTLEEGLHKKDIRTLRYRLEIDET